MRLLMVGDVVGKPGRRGVRGLVPELRRQHKIDLVIANGENAAGGFGITVETARELLQAEVDIITTGNHIWAQKEVIPHLEDELPILRPLNYPPGAPGRGYLVQGKVMVVNLLGRTFLDNFDCPFRAMDQLLQTRSLPPIIIVDFHAEATSEKAALAYHLDGRVSAVLGTHTHVGTVDTKILAKGTAFVSDIGMVGPRDSVIGMETREVITHFLTLMPCRFTVAPGPIIFNSCLLEIEEKTGQALSIQRLDRELI